MKRLTILLAGASLIAPGAYAGQVSNVAGTLDTTIVDAAPALYPHFICAGGCSAGGGGGAVTQSGSWNVGVSNFPAVQAVGGTVAISNLPATQPISGSVTVPGVAMATNQPALNIDGGGLAHITNFPATQPISLVDGADATLGGKSDVQCVSTSGACSEIALLKAMLAASSGPIPTQASSVSIGGVGLLAGTAKVGQVAIDQTTPGATNAVQQIALAPTFSTAAESCHVLKSSAGLLAAVSGYAGQAEFIMIFNTAAPPADTTNPAPAAVGYAGAAGFWALNWTSPLSLSTGITVCDSSTGPLIKTAISTNNTFSGQVQ